MIPDSREGSFAPYVYLVPGVGLAIVTDDDVELVEVPGGLSGARAAAVALSAALTSPGSVEVPPAVDLVIRRLGQLGGTVRARASKIPVPPSHRSLDFRSFAHGEMGATCEERVSHLDVQQALEARGFEIVLREPTSAVQALRWIEPFPLYEVRECDEPDRVIAEGKGLDEARCRSSALGEGAERVLGARPGPDLQLVLATAAELGEYAPALAALTPGPRDALDAKLVTDWVPAHTWGGDPLYLPAELIYTNYISASRVAAIAYKNTTGLAAGRCVEEAVLNGLLEVLERDAYWITMRCRAECPSIDIGRLTSLDQRVLELVERLGQDGLVLHLKDISLDWAPAVIVHALLEHSDGEVPAFSHGSGAAFTPEAAVARAVCEAVQVRSDQCRMLAGSLSEFVRPRERPATAYHAWSDPLWRPHLGHLMSRANGPETRFELTGMSSVQSNVDLLLENLHDSGHEVFWAPLGELGGLTVTRVIVGGATPPDPRLERVPARLKRWASELARPGLYPDAILS